MSKDKLVILLLWKNFIKYKSILIIKKNYESQYLKQLFYYFYNTFIFYIEIIIF